MLRPREKDEEQLGHLILSRMDAMDAQMKDFAFAQRVVKLQKAQAPLMKRRIKLHKSLCVTVVVPRVMMHRFVKQFNSALAPKEEYYEEVSFVKSAY